MGWHIEHHMYAAVPFYNLTKLHQELRHDLPPAPRGLIAAWRDIRQIMVRQKDEPGYEYTPILSNHDK
jgi:fatty acid desaturase